MLIMNENLFKVNIRFGFDVGYGKKIDNILYCCNLDVFNDFCRLIVGDVFFYLRFIYIKFKKRI